MIETRAMEEKTYKNLCLSGGHVKAISLLGCIKRLDELGYLSSINQFIGSSAGSIVCLMICLSMKHDEMQKHVEDLLNGQIMNIEVDSIFNITNTYGLDDGSGFVRAMRTIMETKEVNPDCTFIELAKATGKNLVVCGSNITKKKIEFFSVDTYPNMKVLDALRISVSIPIILQPVLFEESYYVDAGIFDNFPVHYFQHTQHLRDTLGIAIVTKEVPITSFTSYLYNLVHSLLDMTNMYIHMQMHLKSGLPNAQRNGYEICEVNVEETDFFCMNTMQFCITKERYEELIAIGYSSMEKFLR